LLEPDLLEKFRRIHSAKLANVLDFMSGSFPHPRSPITNYLRSMRSTPGYFAGSKVKKLSGMLAEGLNFDSVYLNWFPLLSYMVKLCRVLSFLLMYILILKYCASFFSGTRSISSQRTPFSVLSCR